MSRSIPQINSNRPLGGRYKVIRQLGVGGFGRTYLAEDLHLPGHPQCVVKQLKPQFRSDDTLQMARRCFNTEAQVLYQLGSHSQIPRLLAHFEDNQEFYLAQEFVEGISLTKELVEGQPWSESQVVALLKDVLQVLTFVHEKQVIHRDLKPSNLIRRQSDGKIVLIDFGAVKQVSSQPQTDSGLTNLTISIGTQGYMPNEQLAGKPRFSSDIYAVGVLGIQCLTGIHPKHLDDDEKGELSWHHRAVHISDALREMLDRMVRYDFRDRYPSAMEALEALNSLVTVSEEIPPAFQVLPKAIEDANPESHRLNNLDPRDPDITAPHLVPEDEFSGVDLTLSSDEGGATAIWDQADSQRSTLMLQNSAGKLISDTAGSTSSDLSPHHSSPAPWGHSVDRSDQTADRDKPGEPSEFGQRPLQDVVRTGLTRAVGGHRPDQEPRSPLLKSPSPRRKRVQFLLKFFSALGIITTAVAASLAVQTVMPLGGNQSDSGNGSITRPSPPDEGVPPSLDSTNFTEILDYAHQAMGKKQYETALQYYNRAITLQSDSAVAYAGRCEALNQLQRPESAMVACNDALAYDPNLTVALWSRGNALMLQNRTYEALRTYEDVTFLQGDFAPGWIKRGVALQELGRSAEALQALDQGIMLNRDSAEAWQTKGAALLNLQRYEEAIVALDKALQLEPDSPETIALREEAIGRVRR
ncbi:protein kinase domain-containing protein [Egbenema bharatensis]|uniref:protein kinase domain-containing protein n=1 Tax=Egbenema bharatensis TaxID=3463334 RepID=UPI003A8AE3AA